MEQDRLAVTAGEAPLTVLMLISTRIVGGPGKGLLQLVPALNARGRVRAMLATFRHAGQEETPFMREARERGIALRFIEQRFNFDWRALPQLRGLVKDAGVQVIQTHGYKENFFGLLLKLSTGLPWVCFLHGTTEENLKVRLYHALDRLFVRFADRVVAVSKELAQRVVPARRLPRVRVVENAIAPEAQAGDEFFLAGWRRRYRVGRANVVACVGRLSREKGQDVLLEAAARLRDWDVRFEVVFAGDGPERETLARRTVALGLANHVTFVGEQRDMAMVYRSSEMLVLPSRKEGMPNVILEAMQHGLAIVATRVGAVPEMLRDGSDALLVPPDDERALAAAVKRVLTDKHLARRLGREAQGSLYPRFSTERRTQEMEGIYMELRKEA